MKQRVRWASCGVVSCLVGLVGLDSCGSSLSPNERCPGGVLSGTSVTLVANVITVRGRVTRNGLPLDPALSGSRGSLRFESASPIATAVLDLGARSDGAFSLTLPPAVYRVRWEASTHDSPAPGWLMASGAIVVDALDLRSSREVEIDVSPRSLSLDLHVDGREPPDTLSVLLSPTSDLSIEARYGALPRSERVAIALPGRGQRYRVSVGGLAFGCGRPEVMVPCDHRVLGDLREGEAIRSFSADTVVSSVRLEVDGQPAPDSWGALPLLLRSAVTTDVALDLARASAGRRLWAARYDVSIPHLAARLEGLPPNVAQLAANVSFERSGPVTIRARTATITTRLRLEGVGIERWPTTAVRPYLVLLDREGRVVMKEPITESGQRFRVFHTDATVALYVDGLCGRTSPCGLAVLRPFGRIDQDLEIVQEVPLACISLVVGVDGREASPVFRSNVRAITPLSSELEFSLRAPLALDGVVHILAGDYTIQSSADCEGSGCAGPTLRERRRWEGLRNDRVEFFTQSVRAEVIVRDEASRAAVPYDRSTLTWVDPARRTIRAIARGDGSFDAHLPRAPLAAFLGGEQNCSIDPPTRAVCFTTPVFGCHP